MCRTKNAARSRLARQVVGSLVLFGASLAVLPARVQGQGHSAYSLATTSATIAYQPNPGAVPPARARAWPETIHLNWNTSSGVPPSNTVRIALLLRYQGKSAVFRWDIPRQGDHYTIDLNGIAPYLVATVRQMLEASASEATIPLDSRVSVSVAPVLPGGGLGSYVDSTNDLALTLERVYGDPEALDAFVAITKMRAAAAAPTTIGHPAVVARTPACCPRCGATGDHILCAAPMVWAGVPTTAVVECDAGPVLVPAGGEPHGYYHGPVIYQYPANRACRRY